MLSVLTVQFAGTLQTIRVKAGFSSVALGDTKAIEGIPAPTGFVAEYEFPYLPHAPMEPLNTTVQYDGDRAEVWAGSQFQTVDQAAIAEVLGLKPAQVTFHTEMAGGGFGRRATPDSHMQREAAADRKAPARHSGQADLDSRGRYERRLLPPDALFIGLRSASVRTACRRHGDM